MEQLLFYHMITQRLATTASGVEITGTLTIGKVMLLKKKT